MKLNKNYHLWVFILFQLLLYSSAYAEDLRGKVITVKDGDTI
jgi:hypothetical protein